MQENEIGKNIVSLRERIGLSQADFASRINVSPSTLCRWEKGNVIPSLESIEDICSEFNVDRAELLSGDTTENVVVEVEKNGRKPAVIISAVIVALLTVIGLIYCFIPRYKVLESSELHVGKYGQELTIYVTPVFSYSHEGAEAYSRHIQKRYLNQEGVDALEVVICSSDEANREEYESFVYMK